jgi:NAD(P)-dependent dehydrogenase (short-subunit alcohol dehydrogenase family)
VRRVVITGSNRGLGLEFARQYAADGADVIATCRDLSTATDLRALEGTIEIDQLDINSADDMAAISARLADEPIDLLICNAAVLGGPRSRLRNLDWQAWRDAFETNVIGTMRVATALWPNVAASSGRKIAIISSRAGLTRGAKPGGTYLYRTTKSALNTAGHMLALDLQDEGVVVLLLNPGHVKTGIGGKNAPMNVEESVTAMRQQIEELGPEASGKFWNFDGREIPL